jgi:hypothetical protein
VGIDEAPKYYLINLFYPLKNKLWKGNTNSIFSPIFLEAEHGYKVFPIILNSVKPPPPVVSSLGKQY